MQLPTSFHFLARPLLLAGADGNATCRRQTETGCRLSAKFELGDKKMNRIKNLLGVFAFALLVLTLPSIASAQWRPDRNRDRDDNYGRNSGYNNTQLRNTVRRLRNDSRDFARFVDRELDRGRYDDTNREDNVNRLVNDFKRAAERLESRFDSRDLYKSRNEAQNVINLANQVDRAMRRVRMNRDIQGYWNNIERQVNEIANAYRYNNGRGRSGDWRDRLPW